MYEGERFNGATHLAGLAMAVAASGALIARATDCLLYTSRCV